eukprot:5543554-Prymnesium_polylepis.1
MEFPKEGANCIRELWPRLADPACLDELLACLADAAQAEELRAEFAAQHKAWLASNRHITDELPDAGADRAA